LKYVLIVTTKKSKPYGRFYFDYGPKVDAPEQDKDKYLQIKLTASLTLQIDNERKTPKAQSH